MKLSSIACAPVLVAMTLVGCADKPAATPSNDDATRTTSATPTTVAPASNTDPGAPSARTVDMAPAEPTATKSSGSPSATWSGSSTTSTTPDLAPAPQAPAPATGTAQPPANPDADNTRMNRRDRDSAAVLPMEQGNGAGDLKITQLIRQSVVSDSAMSFNAKNVKIITKDGHVVLRGTVNTQAERMAIEAKAKATAGVADVNNLIDVKK